MKNYLIGLFFILSMVIVYLFFFSQSSIFTQIKLKKKIAENKEILNYLQKEREELQDAVKKAIHENAPKPAGLKKTTVEEATSEEKAAETATENGIEETVEEPTGAGVAEVVEENTAVDVVSEAAEDISEDASKDGDKKE